MYVFLKYQNKKVSDYLFSVRTTAAAGSALTMENAAKNAIDRTTLTSLFVLIYVKRFVKDQSVISQNRSTQEKTNELHEKTSFGFVDMFI